MDSCRNYALRRRSPRDTHGRMRCALALLLLAPAVTACHKAPTPPPGDKPESAAVTERPAATERPVGRTTGTLPAPSSDVPTWAPLGVVDGPPVEPESWEPNGRPTLVVFSASWCPGCTATAMADRMLVREHGDRLQVGVALVESDEDFESSPYARALSGVPVWSNRSTKQLELDCHPRAIPMACLYDKGKVVWVGGAGEAAVVADQHRKGTLPNWLANRVRSSKEIGSHVAEALTDASKIEAVVELTRGRSSEQNSIAWDLVDKDAPTTNEIALAVALSRDAVALDGGIDFAHLDTYALALAKAGRMADAAHVGMRVIEACDAVKGRCSEEKERARSFIAKAKAL